MDVSALEPETKDKYFEAFRDTNGTLKLKDYVRVENLKLIFTRTDTSVIFQDGNMEFVSNSMNKGLAVEFICKKLKISTSDTLIAGNAINDIEMLDVSIDNAILVGKGIETRNLLSYLSSPEKITLIDSPKKFGKYLSKL